MPSSPRYASLGGAGETGQEASRSAVNAPELQRLQEKVQSLEAQLGDSTRRQETLAKSLLLTQSREEKLARQLSKQRESNVSGSSAQTEGENEEGDELRQLREEKEKMQQSLQATEEKIAEQAHEQALALDTLRFEYDGRYDSLVRSRVHFRIKFGASSRECVLTITQLLSNVY